MSENLAGPGDPTYRIENGVADREYFQRPPCVERWLRNKAPTTRKKFLGYMGRFQLLTGLSPEQFLQWCKTVEPVDAQDLSDKTATGFKPAIQVRYRSALRSFLRHYGYNSLPKTDLHYVSLVWHRGYKREEVRKLLSHLHHKVHKLLCYLAVESGLRAGAIMELSYRHITDDFERENIPAAVRLEPRFYTGQKAAGHTFLGRKSVKLIEECLKDG